MKEKKGNARKGRRILLVCGIIFVVLLAIDLFAGNYLVTYSIGRRTELAEDVAPEPSTSEAANQKVAEGWKTVKAEIDEWLTEAKPELVEISSEDGLRLAADFYPAKEDSHLYVIAIHGYTGFRTTVQGYGQMYARHGFHVLTPDLRAHGDSEGSYIGMGWLDRKDIARWIDYLVERDGEAKIFLHGVSMGGATVMMTLGEELPSQVVAGVEDCGYTSVWDIFADEIKYLFHLPTFPFLYTGSLIAKIRAGYSFQEASSLEQVKKVQVPLMFIHGSADNFVHTSMVEPLYEACPTEKKLYIAEGAGHGEAYHIDPERYEKEIFDFLEPYL